MCGSRWWPSYVCPLTSNAAAPSLVFRARPCHLANQGLPIRAGFVGSVLAVGHSLMARGPECFRPRSHCCCHPSCFLLLASCQGASCHPHWRWHEPRLATHHASQAHVGPQPSSRHSRLSRQLGFPHPARCSSRSSPPRRCRWHSHPALWRPAPSTAPPLPASQTRTMESRDHQLPAGTRGFARAGCRCRR